MYVLIVDRVFVHVHRTGAGPTIIVPTEFHPFPWTCSVVDRYQLCMYLVYMTASTVLGSLFSRGIPHLAHAPRSGRLFPWTAVAWYKTRQESRRTLEDTK